MSDAQKVFSLVSAEPPANSQKPEKPGKFAVGHEVQLAGGDVIMTVRKVAKGVVICDWHTDARELVSAEFPAGMLMHAEYSIEVEPEPVFDP